MYNCWNISRYFMKKFSGDSKNNFWICVPIITGYLDIYSFANVHKWCPLDFRVILTPNPAPHPLSDGRRLLNRYSPSLPPVWASWMPAIHLISLLSPPCQLSLTMILTWEAAQLYGWTMEIAILLSYMEMCLLWFTLVVSALGLLFQDPIMYYYWLVCRIPTRRSRIWISCRIRSEAEIDYRSRINRSWVLRVGFKERANPAPMYIPRLHVSVSLAETPLSLSIVIFNVDRNEINWSILNEIGRLGKVGQARIPI